MNTVEIYNIWRVASEAYAYLAGHPFLQSKCEDLRVALAGSPVVMW